MKHLEEPLVSIFTGVNYNSIIKCWIRNKKNLGWVKRIEDFIKLKPYIKSIDMMWEWGNILLYFNIRHS